MTGLLAALGAGAGALLGGASGLALFTAWVARRVERAVPARGRFVDVEGARLHYFDEGEGPPLLLVHGLAGNAGNFTHSLLARLATDHRVVVLERPGSGWSRRAPGAAAGPLADARVVAAFVRALGLERPLVVGHSLGGAVALALAAECPELVRGLALVSPLTAVEKLPPRPFRGMYLPWPLARRLVAWTLAAPVAIARRKRTLDVVFGPDPVPADYAIAGMGILGLRPSGFYEASTDLVAVRADMERLVGRLASLRVPVSVLFGTGDRILDHRRHGADVVHRIPHARVELVEGGHMLPVTMPDRVAAFVREAEVGPEWGRSGV